MYLYKGQRPLQSFKALTASLGKTISLLSLGKDDGLHFTFQDGSRLRIFDRQETMFADKYMRTDDKLDEYLGAQLLGLEIKIGPSVRADSGVHDVAFLEVQTSKGVFTMSNHNEHSGCYAGLSICVEFEPED